MLHISEHMVAGEYVPVVSCIFPVSSLEKDSRLLMIPKSPLPIS